MDKTHRKHANLERPAFGHFHRREWALIGAPCSVIQGLAGRLADRLREEGFRLAFADAEHSGDSPDQTEIPGFRKGLFFLDSPGNSSLQTGSTASPFLLRDWMQDAQGVLVNGNHFRAKKQIVLLHPAKKESLERKLDRLDQVDLILTTPGVTAPYPFLEEKINRQANPPTVLDISDMDGICSWLKSALEQARPPLKGLVLSGGKSQRMGHDKGAIDYHGKEQRDYAADLLEPFCEKVFYSLRPGQEHPPSGTRPVIEDAFYGLGPYGAILSAFQQEPDTAWLVLACDLPLADRDLIAQLVGQRDWSVNATSFQSPVSGFPEPLVAIWEPRAYPKMLRFLSQGYSCPRKVLINTEVKLLVARDPDKLLNVNTPEELRLAREKLAQG